MTPAVPSGWKLTSKIPDNGTYKTWSHTHSEWISGTCMTEPMFIIVPNAKVDAPSGASAE